ncbi:cobalt transporter, partial [Candidatus Micrarchaeota archaeon]
IWALLNRREWLTKEKLPSTALVSSLIFLLQMLNFPVANGTSGHFMGAALASMILGPAAAIVSVASVLIVQAAVFGDGGVLAIGVNVFNMAVVGVIAAQFALNLLRARMPEGVAVFGASWFSVVMAAASASALLSLSGLAPAIAVFSSMLTVHVLIGICEGMITVGAVAVLHSRSKSLAVSKALAYLAAALLIGSFALPFASGEPDGMEKIAINLGFYSAATTIYEAPIPDYAISGLPGGLAVIGAGAVGALLCFAVFTGLRLIAPEQVVVGYEVDEQ